MAGGAATCSGLPSFVCVCVSELDSNPRLTPEPMCCTSTRLWERRRRRHGEVATLSVQILCLYPPRKNTGFFLALDASVTDVSFKELFPTVGLSRVQSHVVTLP